MRTLQVGISFIAAIAITLFATGCTSAEPQKENLLVSAGFRSFSATTPQQKALMSKLPVNTISTVSKDGSIWYVMPNQSAGSVLAGTRAQYEQYRQLASARHVQPAQVSGTPVVAFRGWGGTTWGTREQATRISRPTS